MEAMYELKATRKRKRWARFNFYVTDALPLFCLREFIRENNATKEIHLNTYNSHIQFFFKFFTT